MLKKYKDYLVDKLEVDVKEAALMSYERALELGCDTTKRTCDYDWVLATSYWLGSATSELYKYNIFYDGYYGLAKYNGEVFGNPNTYYFLHFRRSSSYKNFI